MLSFDVPLLDEIGKLHRAVWSPVLFRPIMGSPEQFVIGIAVVGDGEAYLERANDLNKLQCLFSEASDMVVTIAETALNVIEADLFTRSEAAISEFKSPISGVSLGDVRQAQGVSLQQIAVSWMSAMSSLYNANVAAQTLNKIDAILDEVVDVRDSGDRLPTLVLEYVRTNRPTLVSFFNRDIRDGRQRRQSAHGVMIDFAGSRLVANFGTLGGSNFAASVGRIKTRLWDLKVDRDSETSALTHRFHEMIVQHPPMDDPQLTTKQVDRLREALEALEAQADQEEIRLRPLNTVDEIGRHILQKEIAA